MICSFDAGGRGGVTLTLSPYHTTLRTEFRTPGLAPSEDKRRGETYTTAGRVTLISAHESSDKSELAQHSCEKGHEMN
jgi:hypothetical protein